MTTAAVFDIIGIIAFAFSGAIVGIIKRMDIFGITVLAVLTAVGGGILRDVLVGVIPPTTLVHPYGFILSIITSLFVCFLFETVKFSRKGKRIIAIVYNISDTLGLASFTVTGAVTGLTLYPESSIILPVTLGLITAIGGGIFRDILAHRVPVVLKFLCFCIHIGRYSDCLFMGTTWLSHRILVLLPVCYPSPCISHPLWLAAASSAS